ncbi:hypothetical protein IE53DRAFT_121692 [Violaceomyces palustris]|uniref:Uncharacterized protein n=1 Tax=Violaceomyces palustris TaxID=1673888 RepID=A0ACD0P6R9_9BASI|nr:hypothetical protein IE53DRAFT_121692 [Violaceomyces palustris]
MEETVLSPIPKGCTPLPEPWHHLYVDPDKERVDLQAGWDWLEKHAFWGKERTKEVFISQVKSSYMTFSLKRRRPKDSDRSTDEQVGMAKVVGDGSIAILQDVYVLASLQGNGLGVAFLEVVLDHQDRDSWRWMLHAGDRKDWYINRFGFDCVGEVSRGKILDQPIWLLERDGLVVKELKRRKDAEKGAATPF